MHKRVAASLYKELKSNNFYDAACYYVYDPAGKVKTLLQEIKAMKDVQPSTQGVGRTDYQYDLISGKVNKVLYQP